VDGSWPRVILRATVVCTLGFIWTWLFWFSPAANLPGVHQVSGAVDRAMRWLTGLDGSLLWAAKSYFYVLTPVLVLILLGKRPTALGMGQVARYGWRIILLSLVVALPVLVLLGLRPGMHAYYANMFKPGAWRILLANSLVIAVEHAWIEGVVLALALPGGGFSHAEDPPRTGRLAFLGFGQPPGGTTIFTWLGIPPKVFPALVGQALIFGAVHAGKDVGELISAFPGGLGLGMVTYRIRSVWPSVALHLGTGAIILAVIYVCR
jgi:hypothetical protein